MNMYAVWEEKTFTVKYFGTDNVEIPENETQVKYKDLFKVLKNPYIDETKDADVGCEFTYTVSGVKSTIYVHAGEYISLAKDLKEVTSPVCLYSKEIKDYYIIYGTHWANLIGNRGYFYEYEADGTTLVKNETRLELIAASESTAKFKLPVSDGYKFVEYTVNDEKLHSIWDYSLLVKTTDVYAQWKPITYTVRYDANGGIGTMDSNNDIKYDEKFNLAKNLFIKDGYRFIGWKYEDQKDESYIYSDEEEVSNLTIIFKKKFFFKINSFNSENLL